MCLVDLGRYEEALPVSQVAVNSFVDDVEFLMAYGALWEPIDPNVAQWAFRRAKDNDPDLDEAKFAFDSLACPLKGVVRSSYAIEMQPAVSAAYRTMLRRIRTVLTNAWKGAAIAALCCGLFYLFVARGVFPGAQWGVFLLYVASVVSVYFYVGHQIATFNRTLLRGVRLTFMRLCTRFTELGGRIFLFMRVSLISGFFLIAFMNGIG
jgi:hypothetical protein